MLLNLFVTYFLLLSVSKLLHYALCQKRLIIASILGGLYSLVILIQQIPAIWLAFFKLMMSMLLVRICFGKESKKNFLKTLLFFYLVNFIYAGLMFAIWYFISPVGMVCQNGVVYFQISSLVLCITTIAAYLVIQLTSRCLTKHVQDSQLASIQISANNQEVIVTAFVDTGNHASDLLTGLPLIICELQALHGLFPDNVYRSLQTMSLDQIEHPYWKKHLRILPLSAVTGSSVVTGFKPDTCYLLEGNTKYPKEAIIALSSQPLSSGDFSALIGSALVLK